MFWDSVGSGMEVLTHWQTYVAGLLFLSLERGPNGPGWLRCRYE